ncbi:hypothetical protein AAG906_012428 [Vitis piasezkii]
MMWSSTLTTSSTISLPLRLRSTFQRIAQHATVIKILKEKWSRTRLLFFLQKHHLKKGDQSLEIKFLKPTTMTGGVQQAAIQAPYQRRSGAACSVITKSSSSHSGAVFRCFSGAVKAPLETPLEAPFRRRFGAVRAAQCHFSIFSCRQEAPLEAPFERHLIRDGKCQRCRCAVSMRTRGRGVHGAVRVGAIHADGVKIGFWSISDIRCEVPELRGDNFKIWKERILLQLGCMDKDYAIRKYEPHKITDTSTPEEILLYKRWEKSNRLSMISPYKRCMRTHHGNEGHSGSIEETRGRNVESFLDKWSINELMTMCVQEEGMLLMEQRESVMLVTQRKGKKGKSQASKKEVTNSSQI